MLPHETGTILIVEDDPGIAELEQMQLERAGFSVLSAETSEQALERLNGHPVHLVLLDYRLPGDVDGLEVHVQMKAAGFDLPVILVTGFSNEALAIRALRAGVRDFVTKSTEYLDYLPEAVNRVLKQVRLERQLLETEARLTSIIDSAQDAIIIAHDTHRITLFNRAAEAMFRCPASAAVGQPVSKFIARDYQAVPGGNAIHAEGSLTYLIEYGNRGKRADGTEFPLEASLSRTQIDGRKFYTLIVRDITNRKQAEEALAEQAHLSALSADLGLALTTTETLRGTLGHCAEAMMRNLHGAFARIWTLSEADNVLELQASAGMYTHLDGPHSRVPVGKYKIGLIALERAPHMTNDVLTDPRVSDPAWARREGITAFAGFPLLVEDRLLGVMAMFARQPFTQAKLAAMAGAANQIALGIHRKRSEADLSASEQRFRQLAENIREVFWLNDPLNHKILYASPAYETIWGRKCQTLYDSPGDWREAIHPDDRERVQEAFEQQLTICKYDEEYRIFRPDGTIRWIHDRGFPVRDAAGKVYRIAGVAEDITDRRRAEIAEQLQKQRLEGIVNSAMDGIITIDEEQKVILMNAAAERMFGFRSEIILGKGVEMLLPERFRAGHADHVKEFGRTGVTTRAMGRFGQIGGLRASGEEFPIEASISQVQVDGRILFTVTCRDVTERVRTEKVKQSLEAQLHQSQKMEAFGQLAGGIAHDFNNLLTIISGYSEILLTMIPVNDSKRQSVKAISEAGSRAALLTHQLLAFSRKAVLEPKVLDLNVVVRETEKMLRRLIGEDILLTTLLDPSIRQVKVDPGLLGQVLMNLAVNSRDAMPKGGKLSIETGNVELDAGFAHTAADFRPGSYVLLAVSDTGIGMSPEVKARIFEPFFTTKAVGQGTGLGLAVVHGIVTQSSGQVEVVSEPGHGTSFKIYLPAVEGRLSTRDSVPASQNLRGAETILLVEDEESVRGLASLILRSFGYNVLIAEDGRDALRVVESHQGAIDLLLTDVVMPHLSGRELAEQLQPRFPRMKVLFMSGYTDDAMVRHGLAQEKVPFLQKPATPQKLASKVRSVLDSVGE